MCRTSCERVLKHLGKEKRLSFVSVQHFVVNILLICYLFTSLSTLTVTEAVYIAKGNLKKTVPNTRKYLKETGKRAVLSVVLRHLN